MSGRPAGMSDIRTCTADDIPAVARMFQHAFRDASRDAAGLARILSARTVSRSPVARSRNRLARIRRRRRPGARLHRRAADAHVVPWPAGARGAGKLAGGRQSQRKTRWRARGCFARTSLDRRSSASARPRTRSALGMWERMGGRPIAEYSMEWLRPLKPASLGVALLAERLEAAQILQPLAALADRMAARFAPSLAWPAPGRWRIAARRRRR